MKSEYRLFTYVKICLCCNFLCVSWGVLTCLRILVCEESGCGCEIPSSSQAAYAQHQYSTRLAWKNLSIKKGSLNHSIKYLLSAKVLVSFSGCPRRRSGSCGLTTGGGVGSIESSTSCSKWQTTAFREGTSDTIGSMKLKIHFITSSFHHKSHA